MKKRNHIIFGLILSFAFVYFTIYLGYSAFDFNLSAIAVVSFIIVFYSILPDIDHKNSTITWWFFGMGLFGILIGIFGLYFKIRWVNPLTILVSSALLLAFTFASANFFEHRGIIHSIPAGIIAVLPLYIIFHSFAYCILAYVSWYSHLLGDGYLFKIK